MKIISKILFLSTLFSLSFTMSFCQYLGNGVKGTGEVVSKDLSLDDFTGFELAISGDVILSKGSTQKVRVEAQQNIIDVLNTSISGDTWKIKFDNNVSNCKKPKFYITIPALTSIGVSGSGNINTTNTFENLNDLDVFVSGSGNIKLNASAKSIKTNLSGSGNITLDGSVESQNIKISGSGDINAFDLEVEEATVNISGSGECELNVSKNLEVRISGSGDVTYKGAANVSSKITGSGDVKKKY